VHGNVFLLHNVREAADDGDADKVAQSHVDARVRLVLFLDVLELKVEGHIPRHVTRRRKLLHQRRELVRVAAVVEQLDLPDKLNFDPVVLELLARVLQVDLNLWPYTGEKVRRKKRKKRRRNK
jgi:hypothetical protein